MTKPRRVLLNPATLETLRGLELKARRVVEGYVAGLHKSPYHGFSVEFAEHREYSPGEDLRYVDWKVFGKSDRYYLKQYDEETNFTCHLIVDTSASMGYRSAKLAWSKLDYAQHVAATLAYLVVKQRDAVGLATFSQGVEQWLGPASTPSHFRQICDTLERSGPRGETAIGPIFHDLAERIKRRGLIVILSDFFDDPASLLLGLKHFHHRRHDVVLMQIIDPAEEDFPFDEPTLFHGLELEPDQHVDPRGLRLAYQQEFAAHVQQLRGGVFDLHMEFLPLRTDQPLDVMLSLFLSRRMSRRK